MPTLFRTMIACSVLSLLFVDPALAAGRVHRHVRREASRVRPPVGPVYAGSWQAAAIANAAERMRNAPGVTNELAPDAIETATGGPVGGVPGFSGM